MMFLLIVTVTSMLLAAIMSAIAWRVAGAERRRSEARVAALSAAIHDAPVSAIDVLAARQARSGARPVAVVAAGALVFAAAIAVAIVFNPRVTRAAHPPAPAAVVAPEALPLELVALGHERDGNQLIVRGVVRNPAAAADRERMIAVVQLLTPEGGLLASGRAALAPPSLRPGGETAFAVTLPDAAAGARYRVSFRIDDRVVPHVDHRHDQS
jgi:hypothetical protein